MSYFHRNHNHPIKIKIICNIFYHDDITESSIFNSFVNNFIIKEDECLQELIKLNFNNDGQILSAQQ